jgi:hypothetical protein
LGERVKKIDVKGSFEEIVRLSIPDPGSQIQAEFEILPDSDPASLPESLSTVISDLGAEDSDPGSQIDPPSLPDPSPPRSLPDPVRAQAPRRRRRVESGS